MVILSMLIMGFNNNSLVIYMVMVRMGNLLLEPIQIAILFIVLLATKFIPLSTLLESEKIYLFQELVPYQKKSMTFLLFLGKKTIGKKKMKFSKFQIYNKQGKSPILLKNPRSDSNRLFKISQMKEDPELRIFLENLNLK